MQEKIDVSELTIEQLEALCFRLLEQQNRVNTNIQVAQNELAKRRAEPKAETPTETPTEEPAPTPPSDS